MGMFHKMQKAVEANKATDAAAVKLADAPRAVDPRWAGVAKSDLKILDIPLEAIEPDPRQHRKTFSRESIAEMAASLKARGQLSPLFVFWHEEAKKYRIIFGERRFRGAREAGFDSLNCQVLDREPTLGQVAAWQVVENEQREDLAPMEQARSYAETMERNGWTQAQFCKETGLAQSKVAKRLALLKLDVVVQGFVERGYIDQSVAYELRHLEPAQQVEVADLAHAGEWTGVQVKAAVDRRLGGYKGPLDGQASLPIAADPPPAQAAPVAGPEAPETETPYSGGMDSAPDEVLDDEHDETPSAPARPAPQPARRLADEWGDSREFVVTLDDGAPVEVEYDDGGESGRPTLTFRGPINAEGGLEHNPTHWQVTPGQSLLDYAEAFARREMDATRRRAQAEQDRRRRDAERAERTARGDYGAAAGCSSPTPWYGGEGEDYEYFEGDSEDEEASWIEMHLKGRGYDEAIAVAERFAQALRFRRALARIQPTGALPGDLVEVIDEASEYAGVTGTIQPEALDGVRVTFSVGRVGVVSENRDFRGDELRRIGPLAGAGEGGGA